MSKGETEEEINEKREWIEEGAKLGFEGDLNKLIDKPRNYIKNVNEFIGILDTIIDEIKRGWIVPVSAKPKGIVSLQVVRKSDRIKFRLIRNASKKVEGKISLNDGIINEKYIKVKLKNFQEYCKFFEKANFAAGGDISNAYRQTYIRHQDQWITGYQVIGLTFIDIRGIQGSKPMANICMSENKDIINYVQTMKLNNEKDGQTDCYIDDVICVDSDAEDCQFIYDKMKEGFKECNKPFNDDKEFSCTRYPIHVGYNWDLALSRKKVDVTELKKNKYFKIIVNVINIRYASLKVMWSISGKIFNTAIMNIDLKVMARGTMGLIYDNIDDLRKIDKRVLNKVVYVPDRIIMDYIFWINILLLQNGVFIDNIVRSSKIDYVMFSDASGRGFGSFCNGEAAYGVFCRGKSLNIDLKEMLALLFHIIISKDKFMNKSILIFCDNKVVNSVIIKRWARNPKMMQLIYKLVIIKIMYRIEVYVEWIPTKLNRIADLLSRDRIAEYFIAAKGLGPHKKFISVNKGQLIDKIYECKIEDFVDLLDKFDKANK